MNTVTDLWNFRSALDTLPLDMGSVDVARLDASHPVLSGNKFYKLYPFIQQFYKSEAREIWSMGGVYSNHLHAMAFLGREMGIPTAAYVRGWDTQKSTATMKDCLRWGMRLETCSREDYRMLRDTGIRDESKIWIPEGGLHPLGVQGAAQIYSAVNGAHYDTIMISIGSGTTLRGIATMKRPDQKLIGIYSFKLNSKSFADQIFGDPVPEGVHLIPVNRWRGFGKVGADLIEYMADFEKRTGIPLEPIYNAKSMYLLENPSAELLTVKTGRQLYIHSGGLQGRTQDRSDFSLF